MIFYPAIDIRGGKAVRLAQGDFARETVYGEDPVAVAKKWVAEGARWLHVVDLDGAREGVPANQDLIRRLTDEVDVPVQLGGGVRDIQIAGAYLAAGVARVILGSVLIKNPEEARQILAAYPGQVGLGVDAKGGRVAVEGWKTLTERTAVEVVRDYAVYNPPVVVYTDIGRDGMMGGPNFEETARLAREGGVPVVLSGGVSTLQDVAGARALENDGVVGVISGRAIYTGELSVREAVEALA